MRLNPQASRQAVQRAAAFFGLPLAIFASPVAAGATYSPSVDVLGSYFPAWLICIVSGVALTVIARLLFIACKIHPHLLARPIVYPCLAAIFAMTVWLFFFQN
jgi:hypothetical protein